MQTWPASRSAGWSAEHSPVPIIAGMSNVWLYLSLALYLAISTVPRVVMINGWANITVTTLFATPVYYTSNDESHYIFIHSFVSLGLVIVLTILIAVDSLFVMLIQHGCGIFSAVSYRLENLIDGENQQIDFLHPRIIDDDPFWTVIDCIKKHKAAIEYADNLASVYHWSFLSIMVANMLAISFTGLQVLTAASPGSLDEVIRQVLFVGSQLLHLFFENLFSQKLTDHSFEVFTAVTRSKWYQCSMRTRVLLQLILMRSSIHWEMKAGKLITMSMGNFSAVLRTSISYLTIIGSLA